MEALKLKTFDVLTEKISVTEFENWLYDSTESMNEINSNSLYFDIIAINFKSKNWNLELRNLAKSYLHNDYLEILKIKRSCLSIIEPETFEETHKALINSLGGFDYNTDYSILWEFSHFRDYFDLVKEGLWDKGTLEIEIKFHSKNAIETIKTLIKMSNETKKHKRTKTKRSSLFIKPSKGNMAATTPIGLYKIRKPNTPRLVLRNYYKAKCRAL